MRHTPPPGRPFRVIVAVRAWTGVNRRMCDGIARFLQSQPQWEIQYIEEFTFRGVIPLLKQADGVLAAEVYMEEASALLDLPCPVIGMAYERPGLSSVLIDEQGIGRLALDHLHDLGLEQLAFCGLAGEGFSDDRRDSFVQAAAALGCPVHVYPRGIYREILSHPHEARPLADWLNALPKPTGLFVATAALQHVMLCLCRQLGIRVPDEVALLGVDDDELFIELSRPRLSVIDQAADIVGYEAAILLDRLMRGGTPPRKPVLVHPRRVIAHESTDMIHAEDPIVAEAIRYIRQHASDGITVGQVLRHVPSNRRTLERAFRRVLGRTVHSEIQRAKIRRAKHLLHHTALPVETVARESGFSSSSRLSAVFRTAAGVTPLRYRRDVRAAE